ncbi:MAG: Carbon starvation protein CstA [Candidatus Methanolliviera sp. GoM_oil]|nr:MAG: Carbon starvation protein CstA [Candidatus Methanolliviera sp. GoM_oil]
MNSAIVAIAAIFSLLSGYKFYGTFIEKKIVKPEEKPTPAHELQDDLDYSPARRITLFGHHFSSIAGAGPILGPVAAAIAFGWTGCLLWIVLGGIFMGAVHDYLSLMISVRHKGVSIPDLSGEIVSPLARWLFTIFVWITLVLVIAIFGITGAHTLASTPEIVIPVFCLILIAIIFGLMVNKLKWNFWTSTGICIGLMVIALLVGYHCPVVLPLAHGTDVMVWFAILMVYCIFASILPVWLLLRPRDYLSMYILFAVLIAGYIGLFACHPEISTSPFISFYSKSQGPIWPMLFITIACGAVSGFHSLCAGGTTSKQLDKESDGKPIGYGGMITESILAILALMAVTAGLSLPEYQSFMILGRANPIGAFGAGFGHFLTAIHIPLTIGTMIGIIAVNAFVITSLDTCTRMERYVWTESIGAKIPILGNRWIATLIPIAVAYYLGFTGIYSYVWPMFGSANQLVAALALLTISMWLASTKKPAMYTAIPCVIMLTTTIGALIWQIPYNLFYAVPRQPQLSLVGIILLVLAVVVVIEAIRTLIRIKSQK